MKSILKERLDLLTRHVQEAGLDAFILCQPSSLHYYTNLQFDPMERLWHLVIIPGHKPQMIANTLFVIPEDPDYEVIWVTDSDDVVSCYQRVEDFPNPDQEARIGVDEDLRAGRLLPLMEAYPKAHFVLGSYLVDRQRSIKTDQELELMRKSSAINDQAMKRLIEEVLPYGYSELEACERLESIYEEEGAEGISFEPIVAYGANGADPHHVADDSRPQIGDSIICDIGCYYKGYASDMTRTVYYGEVSEEDRRIYEIVREAQQRGIDAVKAGIPFSEIDAACRDYIADEGYGENFTHRTGHFIGLDVHEHGDVSSANDHLVEPGNCFSVEPGIYVTGDTGVRIEDVVVAHDTYGESLNHYPRDLQVVKPETK